MRNPLLSSDVRWRLCLGIVWNSSVGYWCRDQVFDTLGSVESSSSARENSYTYFEAKALEDVSKIILNTDYNKFLQFLDYSNYSYGSDGSFCTVNCFNKNEFKSIDDPRCTLVQFRVGYDWWYVKSCSIKFPRVFSDTEKRIEISCFVSALERFYLNKSL